MTMTLAPAHVLGIDDLPSLGTIVGVWAHPDDEAYLSAGLMAAAIDHGSRVAAVTATRGERGTSDPTSWPPERLARLRERELDASLAALGVDEHRWLDHPDGGLDAIDAATGERQVRRILDDLDADTVVTFGPDGMTGHPDHVAIGRWATAAGHARGATVLHATTTATWATTFAELHARFEVFGPDGPPRAAEGDLAMSIDLPGPLLDRKLAALRAHASQTTELIRAMGVATYRLWWARETFVLAQATDGTRQRSASSG
jgi:LmbE family N-acetylglucosaminyl deacetylase